MKNYTSQELWEEYKDLPNDKKVKVLYYAIDLMHAGNWQSKTEVIFKAMGYKNPEGAMNTWQKRNHANNT